MSLSTYDQELLSLAQDNSEPSTSFFTEEGRKILPTKADVMREAFKPAPVRQIAPSTAARETPSGANFMANLDTQMAELGALKDDPEAYAKKLAMTEASVAAKATDFYNQAQATAAAKYGIPDLENQIRQLKMREQSTPAYVLKYGNIDSDEVVAAKKNLMAARNAADGAIPEILKGNPAFASLQTYATTLIDFSKRNQQREMDKLGDMERRALDTLSGFSTDQREKLAALSGFDDPRQQYQFLKGNQKNIEQVQIALSAESPQEVAALALTGNKYAAQLAFNNEKRVLGADARPKMQTLERIVADPNAMQAAFTEMKNAGAFGPNVKEWEKKMSAAVAGLSGDKEAQRASAFTRQEVAKEYGKFIAEKEFTTDLLGLQNRSKVPPPAWLQAAASDVKVSGNGKISFDQAIALANQADTLEQKKARGQELLSYYTEAVKKQNDSTLFPVRPFLVEQMKAKLTMEASGMNIAKAIAMPFKAIGTGIGEAANMAGLAIGATARLPYEALTTPFENLSASGVLKGSITKTIEKAGGPGTSPTLLRASKAFATGEGK
jgi:hypothetical protein